MSTEAKLTEIDQRLELMQDEIEAAARSWFRKKAEREKRAAEAYLAANDQPTEGKRRAAATIQTRHIGMDEEAEWEGKKAVLKVLETRSMIGATLSKMHTRMGA